MRRFVNFWQTEEHGASSNAEVKHLDWTSEVDDLIGSPAVLWDGEPFLLEIFECFLIPDEYYSRFGMSARPKFHPLLLPCPLQETIGLLVLHITLMYTDK